MNRFLMPAGVVLVTVWCAGAAKAENGYVQAPLRSLHITEGELPGDIDTSSIWQKRDVLAAMRPYAVIDGEGEAYIDWAFDAGESWVNRQGFTLSGARLSVCAPAGKEINGRLFVPTSDLSGMTIVRFRAPAASATSETRKAFEIARRAYYESLLDRNVAGAAWFRHQIRESRKVTGGTAGPEPRTPRDFDVDNAFLPPRRNWRDNDDLSATYALFTGGRAMSENLQLDRVLPPENSPTDDMVGIDTIPSISVPPLDWSALVKDMHPALDALAAHIPEDQHAIFFPSFNALATLADEAESLGTPILRIADVRAENALTRQRYERQLGITLNGLARVLGPHVVKSVAITGSDPYYRTGTDVAILFEAENPSALHMLLMTQIGAAAQANPQAKPIQGEVAGIPYSGMRSTDRSVCAYLATLGDAVVVTNSLEQLRRLADVHRGTAPALKSLPEYIWFRNRYQKQDREESALVFLSDATIRRWCGPRWRIATSRRMRDAAVMSELQAQYMDDLVRRTAVDAPIHADFSLATEGELRMTPHGVWSSANNTLGFLTPLVELPMDKVTKAEADAYARWRDTYQQNWRNYFDPIAVRIGVHKDHVGLDLTVMPLIAGSEYQDFIGVSQGAAIKPGACDPHDTLAQAILAINTRSPMFQRWGNFASMMAPDLGAGALDWLGQSVSLYADPDPFWKQLAETSDETRYEFMESHMHQLPLALHAEVGNSLKLAAFLTGLRAFAQQTAPGMTVWESLTYNDQPYVKVSPTQQAREEQQIGELALYYAASADGLVVTFSESVLKRSLDRQTARRATAATSQPALVNTGHRWLGRNMGLHAGADAVELLSHLTWRSFHDTLRLRSWGNIPILNEWKRRYPEQDSVKVHETYWQTRLVCPGGGTYVWNEDTQTMESTAFGSPANPITGPDVSSLFKSFTFANFGLSFEDGGLRAQTELTRKAE